MVYYYKLSTKLSILELHQIVTFIVQPNTNIQLFPVAEYEEIILNNSYNQLINWEVLKKLRDILTCKFN